MYIKFRNILIFLFLLSIYIRYPFLNNTLLQAAAGHSLIGITPSSRTGAAYLRKFHYQKAVSSHKVPVTLPVIGYLSLVPLLQYHFDISSFTTFSLCVTMSQSYNADSLGVSAVQLLCFICPAG